MPPARQVQAFVTKYVHGGRDLERAACLANLDPKLGKKLYAVPKVRGMIDRQIALIEAEQAKHTAKATMLGVELIDSAVVESLTRKKERLQPEIVRIAYGRLGMMRDNNFLGGLPDAGGTGNSAKTYGQIHTTTLRRTTTEELVQSSETAVQVGKLAPPAVQVPMPRIELMQPEEVEDYPG